MSYATTRALRMALEQRLLVQSETSGVSLDRLRRRVVFERTVARGSGGAATVGASATAVDAIASAGRRAASAS